LPLHLTEHARERMFHAGDPTFVRFLDVMHHRFLLLFYRAWAQAQPTVSLDRPAEDRFSTYIGSLVGLAGDKVRRRDRIEDFSKLYFSGWLGRQTRNRDGLAALLTAYFKVPTQIEEFVGHWMRLPENERTRLGSFAEGSQLGRGAVIGARVWDRQHKIRVRVGPMPLEQYERFLPGGKAAARLVQWVRQYLGLDLDWAVQLVVAREEVPKSLPGQYGRLGWTTWLGTKPHVVNPDKLLLSSERLLPAAARR
jgi:type VI secretion system protein ImpH